MDVAPQEDITGLMFFPLSPQRSKLSLILYLIRLVGCSCFVQDRDWSTVKWINGCEMDQWMYSGSMDVEQISGCTMDSFHDFLFPCMCWYQGKGELKPKGGAAT